MGLALCYNLILSSNKLYFDNAMILLNHITKIHKIIEHVKNTKGKSGGGKESKRRLHA